MPNQPTIRKLHNTLVNGEGIYKLVQDSFRDKGIGKKLLDFAKKDQESRDTKKNENRNNVMNKVLFLFIQEFLKKLYVSDLI